MLSIIRAVGLAAGAVLLGAAATHAAAQRVDPNKIIDLHVNAEQQNVSFRGSVMEGGKFRLTVQSTGVGYALSVVEPTSARFFITVLRMNVNQHDTTFTTLETVATTAGRPAPLRSLPYFTVVVDSVRRSDRTALTLPRQQLVLASFTRAALPPDYCCVSCGGVAACGCAVVGPCGSCCVGNCCPKSTPVDTGPTTLRLEDTQPLAKLGQRACRAVPDAERLYPQFAPATGAIAIRS